MKPINGAVPHESTRLALMPVSLHSRGAKITHSLRLPECCPISKNPKQGSVLFIEYFAEAFCLEVYSLKALVREFIGGFEGRDGYPPERNMEGMVCLIAKMCADALKQPVTYRASLILDAGDMLICGEVEL